MGQITTHKTEYRDPDGTLRKQEFTSKHENDSFADTISLMLGEDITKYYWQPMMQQWVRYHNNR